MAVLLGLFALLDARGIYPDHALANVPFALRIVLQGLLRFVLFQAVLLSLIAPLINLWFLGVSLRRSFAFGAMAMCDVVVTIAQWLALMVACQ